MGRASVKQVTAQVANLPQEALRLLSTPLVEFGGITISLIGLIAFVIGIIVVRLLARLLGRVIVRAFLAQGRDRRSAAAVARLGEVLAFTIGIVIVLESAGIELSAFIAMFAALGVGIGFGLQNLVNNLASGVIVLFEQPVRPGDFIELDGTSGEIRRIGLRATTLQTVDGQEVIIPNSQLLELRLINWTLSNTVVRLRLHFGVAYGSDPDRVRNIVLDVASRHAAVLDEPEATVQFEAFGSSSLDFVLLFWVAEPSQRQVVLSDLRYALDRAFHEHGIEIPFPQRDLHLRSVDPE
ncbi:MAG: mechanosensitive ion channel family protein, partial [Candidatus Dadabacteria bacterium]